MQRSIIAIDPGIGSTGWAYWEARAGRVPTAVGLVREGSDGEWQDRAFYQARRLMNELPNRNDVDFYCEMPIFFAGTTGGIASVGTGSLQKLCFYIGCVRALTAFFYKYSDFHPVLVRDWKGQLPKKIVNKRIVQLLGAANCEDFKVDIWDAVGIGLWAKGVFK